MSEAGPDPDEYLVKFKDLDPANSAISESGVWLDPKIMDPVHSLLHVLFKIFYTCAVEINSLIKKAWAKLENHQITASFQPILVPTACQRWHLIVTVKMEAILQ